MYNSFSPLEVFNHIESIETIVASAIDVFIDQLLDVSVINLEFDWKQLQVFALLVINHCQLTPLWLHLVSETRLLLQAILVFVIACGLFMNKVLEIVGEAIIPAQINVRRLRLTISRHPLA